MGCDINNLHLDRAKKDGKPYENNLTFHQGDMLNFSYTNKFDAVINMFYSFGFFEDNASNVATLKNFYDNLKPGGQFLFHTDVNINRVIPGKYRECEERPLGSGRTLKIIDKHDPATRRIIGKGKWIIQDENDEKEYDYSVRVYDSKEFVKMCEDVNFTNIKVYGDWNGREFNEVTEDMIIVAQKPF